MIGAECTAIVSSRSVGFGMKTVPLRSYRDVRFRGKSGKHLLVLSSSQFDPNETSALDRRRADRSRLRLHQALLQPCKSSAAYSRINSYLMGKSASVAISHVSHTRRLRDP